MSHKRRVSRLYLLKKNEICLASFCLIVFIFGWYHFARTRVGIFAAPPGYPVINAHSCGSHEEQVQQLFQWAVANGAYIHPNMTINMFSASTGQLNLLRGLIATEEISAGQLLFNVPDKLFMSIASIGDDPSLGKIYNQTPQLHDGFGGLAFYLLHEALNETSRWRPFICSLPKHVSLPLFYSQSKLAGILASFKSEEARKLREYIDAQKDAVDVLYTLVMSTLFTSFPDLFDPAQYTLERWAWACSIIFSRSWNRIHSDPILQRRLRRDRPASVANISNASTQRHSATVDSLVGVHVLVPAADMPNHSPLGREAVRGSDGSLRLYAATNISQGDQFFISYGRKCAVEFLASYGFNPFASPAAEGIRVEPEACDLAEWSALPDFKLSASLTTSESSQYWPKAQADDSLSTAAWNAAGPGGDSESEGLTRISGARPAPRAGREPVSQRGMLRAAFRRYYLGLSPAAKEEFDASRQW